MAEVLAGLGVAASLAQLADYGFRLSIKLYAYTSAVSKAEKSIQLLSTEVSLTSAVLKELSSLLNCDEAKFVSQTAINAVEGTVRECLNVFEELGTILDKFIKNVGKDDERVEEVDEKGKQKLGVAFKDKLKWPFLGPKIELLQSNLDRMKASLTLMLSVLNYANDISSRKKDQNELAYQKVVIETLSKAEKEATKKYQHLQRTLEYKENELNQARTREAFQDRELSRASTFSINQRPPPYEPPPPQPILNFRRMVQPTSTSDVKPSEIGKLLILFDLTRMLLERRIQTSSVRLPEHKHLRNALHDTEEVEVETFKTEFGTDLYKNANRNITVGTVFLGQSLESFGRDIEATVIGNSRDSYAKATSPVANPIIKQEFESSYSTSPIAPEQLRRFQARQQDYVLIEKKNVEINSFSEEEALFTEVSRPSRKRPTSRGQTSSYGKVVHEGEVVDSDPDLRPGSPFTKDESYENFSPAADLSSFGGGFSENLTYGGEDVEIGASLFPQAKMRVTESERPEVHSALPWRSGNLASHTAVPLVLPRRRAESVVSDGGSETSEFREYHFSLLEQRDISRRSDPVGGTAHNPQVVPERHRTDADPRKARLDRYFEKGDEEKESVGRYSPISYDEYESDVGDNDESSARVDPEEKRKMLERQHKLKIEHKETPLSTDNAVAGLLSERNASQKDAKGTESLSQLNPKQQARIEKRRIERKQFDNNGKRKRRAPLLHSARPFKGVQRSNQPAQHSPSPSRSASSRSDDDAEMLERHVGRPSQQATSYSEISDEYAEYESTDSQDKLTHLHGYNDTSADNDNALETLLSAWTTLPPEDYSSEFRIGDHLNSQSQLEIDLNSHIKLEDFLETGVKIPRFNLD